MTNQSSNPALVIFRSGVSLVFYCNDGFRITTKETPIITCINGIWRGSTNERPSCQLKRPTDRCGPVPEIERTKHYVLQHVLDAGDGNQVRASDQRFTHGTRVIYVCETNFRQVGSPMVECQKGEWSGHGPKCLRQLGCREEPPTVENAEFSIYPRDDSVVVTDDSGKIMTSEGSQAFYFCQSGYRMSNANSTLLVCKDGEWVGNTPSCGTINLIMILICSCVDLIVVLQLLLIFLVYVL